MSHSLIDIAALAAVLVWLGMPLFGCDDGGKDELPPSVVLGTGEWQFESLTEGQRVQLVAGTQGGYHVWLSLRVRGMTGARLRMQLELLSDSAAPRAASDLEISFEPVVDPGEPGVWIQHLGWPAQLLSPWCAVERNLSIQVTMSDLEQHSAAAAIDIVPTAPVHGFSQTCAAP